MILITGGAGFIGSHLIDALLPKKEIICVDNFDPFYPKKWKERNIFRHLKNKKFKFIKCDIRDKGKIQIIFKNDIEGVIHLAAKAGVRYSLLHPKEYMDVNVNGTLELLELCRKNDIKKFIFGSSSSVYGISSKVPFSETDPCEKPISPYGVSKRAGELLCFTYSHLYGLSVSCLRFFTVYGPRQRPDMAIHKFTKLIDEGKDINMFGDGTTKRDYTYITDIIQGILSAINKKPKFEIFNLGNSKTIELKTLISLIEKNLGKKAKIKRLPMQAGDVPITYADISKSKEMLGYKPKVTIKEGIKKFVKWYVENKEYLS